MKSGVKKGFRIVCLNCMNAVNLEEDKVEEGLEDYSDIVLGAGNEAASIICRCGNVIYYFS